MTGSGRLVLKNVDWWEGGELSNLVGSGRLAPKAGGTEVDTSAMHPFIGFLGIQPSHA